MEISYSSSSTFQGWLWEAAYWTASDISGAVGEEKMSVKVPLILV